MTQNTCSGCPVQQGTHKPVGAVHQIEEPDQRVSDTAIDAVFNGMPDGARGFLKSWGYRQFARGVLALAAPAAQAVEPVFTWTGTEADDAMILLDRMDDSLEPERIAQLEQIVPRLGARICALTQELAALRATPPAPAAAAGDERTKFEDWAEKNYCAKEDLIRGRVTGYRNPELNQLFRGWVARAALAAPQAQPQEAAAEHQALRDVYEQARGVLRHDGVDQQRALRYRDGLIEAIEAVKTIDGGNWEPSPQAQDVQRDAIRALIAKHSAELEHNHYAYFELAYTRQTGWMAWITDHPRSMPHQETIKPDRKVLASGQGDTAEAACAAAIAASAAKGGA